MPVPTSVVDAIDTIFSELDKPNAPGLAVAVLRDEEPIYMKAFGLACVEHNVPNTCSTLFDIGSITKQFTAFATLMLAQEGMLTLDDPVRKYVPALPDLDPPVRIKHCLYHTSGLTDWIEALELTGPIEDVILRERAYRTITALTAAMFPAGQEHSYSNTGFVLLAWIVQHISGLNLPEFLKQRVFDPLGMPHAGFLTEETPVLPNKAFGYCRYHDGIILPVSGISEVAGDGMMHASADDMIPWLRNLTALTVGDRQLLDLFFNPGELDDGQKLTYAAGWEIDRYRGHIGYRHGGLSNGYQSHIAWFPDMRTGIAILGNVRPFMPWVLANDILDVLMKPAQVDTMDGPTQTTNPTPGADAGVSGRYFTSTGLPVIVDQYDEGVRIDIWFWRRPFERRGRDDYIEPETGDRATFHRNAAGHVIHFSIATMDGTCPRLHSPIRHAKRYEALDLSPDILTPFEGRYFSDELETMYRIVVRGDGLQACHMRCFDWRLGPIASCETRRFNDEFAQAETWPGIVHFERCHDVTITGFRVRGARANVFFRKLPNG